MTERTYKKDLEIINLVSEVMKCFELHYLNNIFRHIALPYLNSNSLQWFRDEVSKEEDMPEDLLTLLFSHVDPIYELHCSFLKDIEQRMATW